MTYSCRTSTPSTIYLDTNVQSFFKLYTFNSSWNYASASLRTYAEKGVMGNRRSHRLKEGPILPNLNNSQASWLVDPTSCLSFMSDFGHTFQDSTAASELLAEHRKPSHLVWMTLVYMEPRESESEFSTCKWTLLLLNHSYFFPSLLPVCCLLNSNL